MKKYLLILVLLGAIGLFAQPTRPTRPVRLEEPTELIRPRTFMDYHMQVSKLYREFISAKGLTEQKVVKVSGVELKLDNTAKAKFKADKDSKLKQLLATIDSLKIEAQKLDK